MCRRIASNFTFVATRPIVLVNQMLENKNCNHDCFLQYNDGRTVSGKILTKELAQELHEKE
jgi:hypothetical protein